MASMFDYLGKQARVGAGKHGSSAKRNRPRYELGVKGLGQKLKHTNKMRSEQRNFYRYLQDNPMKRYNSRA